MNALIDKREDGKKLYAIAYEYRLEYVVNGEKRRKWVPEIDYLHAIDDGDARLQYLQSEPPSVMRETRIVGVAPVIGYFVNDSHGDDVSA